MNATMTWHLNGTYSLNKILTGMSLNFYETDLCTERPAMYYNMIYEGLNDTL